jgi:hypothetical protein
MNNSVRKQAETSHILASDTLKTNITSEAERIEEDAEHSGKGHYNASARWGYVHYCIGVPMAIMAGISGAASFYDHSLWAGTLALLTAGLGAVQTFINPEEKSQRHKAVAGQYISLRNDVRCFRNILLLNMDAGETQTKILDFSSKRNLLNENSPSIPRWAYWLAKSDVDTGYAQYKTDQSSNGEEA